MKIKEDMVKYLPMIHPDLQPYCVWDKKWKGYIIFDDGSNPLFSKKYGGRVFKSPVVAWKALRHTYREKLSEVGYKLLEEV